MSPAVTGSAVVRRLRRPVGIVDGARWLLQWLAVLSLLVTLPAPLTHTNGTLVWLTVASSLVLLWSWTTRLARTGSPVWLDAVDAVAFTGFALACPDPTAMFGLVFGTLWLRSMYGTVGRVLLRCVLFAGSIVAVVVLWQVIPGHAVATVPAPLLGALPTLFLMALVGGQLGKSLPARELDQRRDAVLASVGSRLLGQTDRETVLQVAWDGLAQICASTPGLRILKVVEDGLSLRVPRAIGAFSAAPASLPRAVLDIGDGVATVADRPALNAVTGTPCQWLCLPLPEVTEPSWLLLGAPRQVPDAGVVAVRSLMNQIALALRNSAVHAQLMAQARTDGLTTLANRAAFNTALMEAIEVADPQCTLLFLDLDDFKHVNDSLGHVAGDELLTVVAARLLNAVRPQDLCARLGGDEFAVLLEGTPTEGALQVARRVVEAVSAPVRLGGETARVGVSIGVASALPGMDVEEITRQADVAMYAAKAHGKGRVEVFDAGLLGGGSDAVFLERRVGAAAAAGELVVHYQPVMSLPDLTCIGFEALVRWQDPARGLVPPAQFIDVAERTGAIVDIGAFVLNQACEDFAAWGTEHATRELLLHVNVSARQLSDDGFVALVTDCLNTHGVPASCLVLELTESVVLDSALAVTRLHDVAALGVQIAIDDFGTGYSSLSTLRSLPVSAVKIDRSFVEGAATNPSDQALIETIVHMAARLGLRTVAEGVERVDQQEFLAAAGAGSVQGFLHLRPAPAADFTDWLRNHFNNQSVVVPQPRSSEATVLPLRAGGKGG